MKSTTTTTTTTPPPALPPATTTATPQHNTASSGASRKSSADSNHSSKKSCSSSSARSRLGRHSARVGIVQAEVSHDDLDHLDDLELPLPEVVRQLAVRDKSADEQTSRRFQGRQSKTTSSSTGLCCFKRSASCSPDECILEAPRSPPPPPPARHQQQQPEHEAVAHSQSSDDSDGVMDVHRVNKVLQYYRRCFLITIILNFFYILLCIYTIYVLIYIYNSYGQAATVSLKTRSQQDILQTTDLLF